MTDFTRSETEADRTPRNPGRRMLMQSAAGLVALGMAPRVAAQDASGAAPALKGNINHSVARWTFGDLSLPELCNLGQQIGLKAIDLCGPDDWPVLREHGLDSSMCNGAEISLEEGWANPAHHEDLVRRYSDHIRLVADAGYQNLICFSGNRGSISDEDGLANCVLGLQRILPAAQNAGVTVVMELLNSKVDHPDYMCDRSPWGIELCRRLDAPNFGLLYDIYHMQIMEGDVIRTIHDHNRWFRHYHTAGNPGRHEPDDSQELNYPAICHAIRDSGFTGYLAQEFIPTSKDPAVAAEALRQAVLTCDV